MFESVKVPVLHIAKSMPEAYNYLTNSVFCDVHYYNGNSFRLSPFQHIRGSIGASDRRLQRESAWIGLHKLGLGENKSHRREPEGPKRGSRFLNSPLELVKTGAVAVKDMAQTGELFIRGH